MNKEEAAAINKEMNKMKNRTAGPMLAIVFGLLALVGLGGMLYFMFTDGKAAYIVISSAVMGATMFASVVTTGVSGR